MTTSQVTLHLRSETKPLEHRSALTPTTVRQLVAHGFKIHVERSPVRIFEDSEYEAAGGILVPEGQWPNAPRDHIIIGLKELPEQSLPLSHTHIYFAHCYKRQAGWEQILSRFAAGKGTLYDLEFLEDPISGKRVAAFGYHAGYAGAALAIMDWAWQLEHGGGNPLPGKDPYKNEDELIREVKASIGKSGGNPPRVLVIGAWGRCGKGALDLCRAAGIPQENLLEWDYPHTQKGGPFPEIRESDIFINCIYLDKEIPKFVTEDFLRQGERRLSVVCDVSCDTTNQNNPIPFCNFPTTFDHPTIQLPSFSNPPLSYITIDHLPSLLPREASENFSTALLPSLLQLKTRDSAPVWEKAERLFREKVGLLNKFGS